VGTTTEICGSAPTLEDYGAHGRCQDGAVDVRALLEELATSEARFHGWAPDVEVSWGLNDSALDLLVELVTPGMRTLETGVGFSTVAFGALGAEHTVVSPAAFEHDRVRAWCGERGVDLGNVTFVAAPSQDALPAMAPTPLDLVLIDGDHAFPAPFIDFWYAGGRLVPGGLVVVDDTHLRACRVLADFLRQVEGRWRVHRELATTTVFERLDGPLVPPEGWAAQPWGATPLPYGPPRSTWTKARDAVRLRTRLRAAAARLRAR
jgi:predicted O-methyltransferase YrrM